MKHKGSAALTALAALVATLYTIGATAQFNNGDTVNACVNSACAIAWVFITATQWRIRRTRIEADRANAEFWDRIRRMP